MRLRPYSDNPVSQGMARKKIVRSALPLPYFEELYNSSEPGPKMEIPE